MEIALPDNNSYGPHNVKISFPFNIFRTNQCILIKFYISIDID